MNAILQTLLEAVGVLLLNDVGFTCPDWGNSHLEIVAQILAFPIFNSPVPFSCHLSDWSGMNLMYGMQSHLMALMMLTLLLDAVVAEHLPTDWRCFEECFQVQNCKDSCSPPATASNSTQCLKSFFVLM